ncbi:SixA phosphatase family protein [Actinomarinicola tropica]|uniref:Histidine phosphatase family protein n=1 Tax=Actinomarinicola tropica TaxID=2789776 RepID=A0A5Q2RKF0_9ACTN|nr:phosphoglycerate mutase family protein [Actinomarinicola tropica]QGG94537.1 hypothetical protein GH723_05130 [Actinomarinicola tropica]
MPLYLVRHAHAGRRDAWVGPDGHRPLSDKGRRRADELGQELADLGIARILSSPLIRCVETMEPLAARLGLSVEHDDALREGAALAAGITLVEGLAREGTVAALCSHGDVIPELLAGLARRGARLDPDGACPKGSVWVLHVRDGEVVEADYAGLGPLPRG